MRQNEPLTLSHNDEVRSMKAVEQSLVAFQIDSEIERYSSAWRSNIRAAILRFAPFIEQRFENDTRVGRVRELRFSVTLGLILFFLTTITDLVFVPDLGLYAFYMRLIGAPLLLLFLFIGSKLSERQRETLVTAAATTAIIILATIPTISTSSLAPYAFTTALMGLIYANTTFPLRFKYTCFCSAICTLTITSEIFIQTAMSLGLRGSLVFQLGIACLFSTVTSYRIERSVRLNFLLACREALRLSRLSADREALTTLSNTDALTGVLNRRYFDRQSASIFANPGNFRRSTALLFIDVDHFKSYNDHYGHPAGDACLRAVSSAISGALGETNNLIARYGGEEFAVLLLDVNKIQAKSIAIRVCKAVSAQAMPHLNRPDRINIVSISVGMAHGVVGGPLTIHDLIEASDKALYDAKKKGRNQVSIAERREFARAL